MSTRSWLGILLVVSCSLTGRIASANEFNIVAASCAPQPQYANPLYVDPLAEYARVIPQDNVVQSLNLFCSIPVTISPPSPSHLYALYMDNTGSSSTRATVRIEYWKRHKSTGAGTEIAEINSNAYTDIGKTAKEVTFSDSYDPSTYYYFIRIYMQTTWINDEVRVYGVTVW